MQANTHAIAPDKVAVYIRWSTEDQGEGTTLDVQLEGCRHYLLSQGWRLRDDLIVVDDGHSGATLDRPGLSRLRHLVRQGEVECVVVYKLDRLSRSVADTARLCMDEWDGVCAVRSAREPIDTTSQAGRMFFYTLTNYAEWERSVIRDRTHSGRVRRAQEGRSPGITPPYGYEKAGSGFAAVPGEAEVVREIFHAYQSGAGLLAIANGLNRRGIPFRGGRRWQVGTIAYMLSNRAYAGDLVWGQRMRNPRHSKRAGEKQVLLREEPLVVTHGVFPPIIAQEQFAQVQVIKRTRPTVGRGGGGRSMASHYLLTGLLRCSLCGRPMVGQHSDSRRKHGYYYCCITRRDQGASVCPARHIQCRLLDEQVEARLLSLHANERARRQAAEALQGEAGRRLEGARAQLAEVQRQLERMADRDLKLCRDYNAEVLTLDEFRRLRAALQADTRTLETARETLALSIRALEAALRDSTLLAAQVERLQLWEDLPVPHRKELLRSFVAQIVARRTEEGVECEVTWRTSELEGRPGDTHAQEL